MGARFPLHRTNRRRDVLEFGLFPLRPIEESCSCAAKIYEHHLLCCLTVACPASRALLKRSLSASGN
jgi:hypothetical protein